MGDFGLDPETALKLIHVLLRGAGYFFGGFALLGLSAYVVFLCLEIIDSEAGPKVRIAKLAQPIGCAPAADENYELTLAETPTLAEETTVCLAVTREEAKACIEGCHLVPPR